MKTLHELADALEQIRSMAEGHAAFDEVAFINRDFDALSKAGGATSDWTMIAILADDALKPK